MRRRDLIDKLVHDRDEAKAASNYELADHLRNKLDDMCVIVEDGKDGSWWRYNYRKLDRKYKSWK